MSIMANNFKLSFKVVMVAILLVSGLFTATAYGLGKTSSASVYLSKSDSGSNVNIWEGAANVNGNVGFVGPSPLPGGVGAVSLAVMRSISVFPDKVEWQRVYTSPSNLVKTRIGISQEGTYYANIDASGLSSASFTLESLDKNN
ncbi:MAG: hypothetical protein ABS939_02975 [Psychrobacillus sp.]